MPVNIGTLDQYVRIVLGLALIAYADEANGTVDQRSARLVAG